MSEEPRVLELIEQILDSEATPEDVCRSCPELLPQVRARLHRLRALEGDVEVLFPSTTPGSAPLAGPVAGLPRVPGYEVRAVLGRGGVGVVYRAWQVRLQRDVALKMLLAGPYAQVHERERFLREVEAVAGLRHPNIVSLYDAGEVDGRPYFTMELVEGGSLAQKIAGKPQPAAMAAALVAAVADAVQLAHQSGIIHRDLKPGNILLTTDGTPKVSDFGLARRLESGVALTVSGVPVGTPSYMAPEQARGQKDAIGTPADIYALGAILYETLTGRPPFEGETAMETLQQVMSNDPLPPRHLNRHIPRDLEIICLKCLHKEPARRYRSAAELADDLRRQVAGESIQARPTGTMERGLRWLRRHPVVARTLVAGLVLVAVLLVLAYRWHELHQAAVQAAVVQAERDLNEAKYLQKLRDFTGARDALHRAIEQLGEEGPAELHERLALAARNLELVERLDTIRVERTLVVTPKDVELVLVNRVIQDPDARGVTTNSTSPGPKYAAAFSKAGLGTMDDDPTAVAGRIKESLVYDDLIAALDDWLACPSSLAQRDWVVEVVRQADPDAWRNQVRNPDNWNKPKMLEDLAEKAVIAKQSPQLLVVLAARLRQSSSNTRDFITQVAMAHPIDFWVNLEAASTLHYFSPLEAMGYYRTALSLRPNIATVHVALGLICHQQNRPLDALEYFTRAVHLNPAEPLFHTRLGFALHVEARQDEAIAAFDEAIKLAPNTFWARFYRCRALIFEGRFSEALEDCKAALQAAPQYADGKTKVSGNWDLKEILYSLYLRSNRGQELLSLWRKQLDARPLDHDKWFGYAELCLFVGDIKEYERHRDELLALFGDTKDPQIAERVGRACLLRPWTADKEQRATGLIDLALAAPPAQSGSLRPFFLFAKGLAAYRGNNLPTAIQLMQGPAEKVLHPSPLLVAAMARHRSGQKQEALRLLAEAVLSSPWSPGASDVDAWISHVLRREAETMILPHLAEFLDGKYNPQKDLERVALLGICQTKGMCAALARLYKELFATTPKMAENLRVGKRFAAAAAAAVAGCGGGADGAQLNDEEKAQWRKQALTWLRQDLDAWTRKLKTANPQDRAEAKEILHLWRFTTELVSVRKPKALAKLPLEERQEWVALWHDHDRLLKEVQTPK